jgi:hypothetical protein
MFFTPELLAKRDSGFGLLWYASCVTLGSSNDPILRKVGRNSGVQVDVQKATETLCSYR